MFNHKTGRKSFHKTFTDLQLPISNQTLSVPMLRVRASAERYHIYPFIPQFYSYSLYEQTYHYFGINISTSVSHRCSPLFIGIHLFIHSLSHLASEGLTWRSLRPSKVKVNEPTSLAGPQLKENPKFQLRE